MNTISFEDVLLCIRENKTPYVKVSDLAKKRVYDFQDTDDFEVTCNSLMQKRNILASYSCLYFTCATETIKKGGWQNPFVWCVKFDNVLPIRQNQEDGLQRHTGFVSAKEAELMAELSSLKLQMQFQKQIDDLSLKLNGAANQDWTTNLHRFIPALPLFIKDKDTLASMAGLAAAMNTNGQQVNGMAGKQEISLQTEKTPDEQKECLKIIGKNIDELINKVGFDKVQRLVVGINNKPNLVDAALGFL